ncbi:adenine deaminase C-terminal domain-containing protein [Rossellomorea sp. H39__3]
MKVDMLVTDVRVYNSYFKRFTKGNVAIKDGKFFYIGDRGAEYFEASDVVAGDGSYMVPGLIDIHLHIESTMVTPATFSYGLIRNGVTTIVPEPHEMANVFGLSGVKEMIRASESCEVDMFYSIPSSVPATSMETTGGAIGIGEIDDLLRTERIKCLGEIMNFYEIITEAPSKTNAILEHMNREYPDLIIEGHVPKLLDLELQQVAFAGVHSDHTHQTVEGMEQRMAAGMFVEIQEKSMTPEVMEYLISEPVEELFCFITDDVMADSFTERGHLNVLLKKAIAMGMTPEMAIYACTYTPAQRMRMYDRGTIAPSKVADFLLFSDLESFEINEVYKAGRRVYDVNQSYDQAEPDRAFPESFYKSVDLAELSLDDFTMESGKADGAYMCRVIQVKNGSTFTEEVHRSVVSSGGRLQWEGSGLAQIATFSRYGTESRAHGLIAGDIIKSGAFATTYSHDNHNLLVVGHSPEDMLLAANEVIRKQGGVCCVEGGKILSMLELPVGGILSEDKLECVSEQVGHVTASLKAMGYEHYNVIMSLSTLSLPVSPALKITDRGLIDVNGGRVVPLIVE